MDRAGQGDGRRFEGGIFSGNGVRNGMGNSPGNRPMYRERCYGCYYAQCPQKKENDQKTLLVLAIVAITALLLAFVATLVCFVFIMSKKNSYMAGDLYGTGELYGSQLPYESEIPYFPELPYMPDETVPMLPFEEWNGKVPEDGMFEEDYYTELQDAIRTDLSYQIEWKNYEFAGNNDNVMIAVDYPVIHGSVPNREILNQKIAEETEYFEEYFAEYSQYMLPDEVFVVYSEGFVTYMDEEVMSVVFCESIYTDYWTDCALYCLNIDMENGVVLDNRSIVQIDDAFAVDFRLRSREQNGTIGQLEYMSDQEIAYYLSDAGTGILFYTPMGMEIGLNYEENYVTVTYKDYEKYLQRY